MTPSAAPPSASTGSTTARGTNGCSPARWGRGWRGSSPTPTAPATLSDGRRFESASAAELAASLLGVEAPFASLPRWITARPGASAEVRAVDAQGRPRTLVDQGWTIDYTDYTGEAPDALPRKIDVQRGDTRLRLIVDAWNP